MWPMNEKSSGAACDGPERDTEEKRSSVWVGDYNVTDVRCPRKGCWAGPGASCIDRSGRARRPHATRLHLAGASPTQTPAAKRKLTWYLTLATKTRPCDDCGAVIKPGDPVVFRKATETSLCALSASRMGIEYSESKAWREREVSDA